jgi:hypothetical protein
LYKYDISYNIVSDVIDYYNTGVTTPDAYMLSVMASVKSSLLSLYIFFGDCIYGVNYTLPPTNLLDWSVKDLLTAMGEGINPFTYSSTPNLYDCWTYNNTYASDILNYFNEDNLSDALYRSKQYTTLYNNFTKKSDVLKFIQNYFINKSDGKYLLNYSEQNITLLIKYINNYLSNNKNTYYNIVTNILYNNNVLIPDNIEIEYQNQNYSYYYSILQYSNIRMTYENSNCDIIITSMIANTPAKYSWVNEPGHYLFEILQLLINGDVFDYYNSQLLSLKTKLFTEFNKLRGYNKLIQNTTEMLTYNNLNKSNKQFILPLDFYFCREITSSLPLTNILYSDITLNFKTRKLIDLLVVNEE